MSSGIETEQEENIRVLRRSKRTRKTVVPFGGTSEEDNTEVESETETLGDWNIGDLLDGNSTVIEKEESDVEGSEYSFGSFSNTAHIDHSFQEGGHRLKGREETFQVVDTRRETKMSSSKEQTDRAGGSTTSTDSGRGKTPEPALGDFFRFYMEDQKRRDEEAKKALALHREDVERREEESRRREEEARRVQREDALRRDEESRRQMETQQKMLDAMMARADVRDSPLPTQTVRLPTLQDGGDVETFITSFETTLRLAEIPRRLWKRELVTHIPMDAITRVSEVANERDSTYEEVLGALRGSVALSFGSAAEDFFSGEKGRVYELDVRPSLSRLKHLVKAIAGDALSIDEVAEKIAVAAARDHLVPPLRTIIDTGMRFQYKQFVESCEQWAKAQPRGTSCYRKLRSSFNTPLKGLGGSQPGSAGPVLLGRQ